MSTLEAQVQPGATAVASATRDQVLPLEPGDRLSRNEYERRYRSAHGVSKAELIEGVVHMPSPVRIDFHGFQHVLLSTLLGNYFAATPGVKPGDNSTTRLDLDNEPQPDLLLMIEPSAGGQARIDRDGYVEGAPELVVEIAASTVSIDVHSKLNVYRRTGVREYLVWRVRDVALDWYELTGSEFVLKRVAVEDGTLRSAAFPGLWLDVTALIAGDMQKVNATLQQGLATPEHAAFVAQLQAKKSAVSSSPEAVARGNPDGLADA